MTVSATGHPRSDMNMLILGITGRIKFRNGTFGSQAVQGGLPTWVEISQVAIRSCCRAQGKHRLFETAQ
jgi:hypothetical protein